MLRTLLECMTSKGFMQKTLEEIKAGDERQKKEKNKQQESCRRVMQ